MNQHLHRIVFNKKRGLLMAVAETAQAGGKSPGTARAGTGPRTGLTATLRPSSFAVLVVLGAVTFTSPMAGAQSQATPSMMQTRVVADPNAPKNQQPTVLDAANGVPVVNIQTPSAAGVSRNTYNRFDVGGQGVVLNNARSNVQTRQAGWVQGNPWLATGTARVILNEVNSNDQSLLHGYVEVAGDRAQVVIANPAGITCDGCGFINASHATLTTGTPLVNGGSLDGYRVQRGLVSIVGAGLDTSTVDYTQIIARSVQVNAGLWAQQLMLVTGVNDVSADPARAPTSLPGGGAPPAFGIDVSQLGGMYAGKIVLVGTEAGVGVRNAGQIGASAGDVIVSADGRVQSSGSVSASGAIHVDTNAGIANSGTVYARGDTRLVTRGDIDNSGLIAAQGQTTLAATGALSQVINTTSSVLAAGLNGDGTLSSGGRLQVSAIALAAAHGQNLAGDALAIDGAGVDIADSQTSARSVNVSASRGDVDMSRARVAATTSMSASAAQTLRSDDGHLGAPRLQLAAHDLSNQRGELVQTGADDLHLSVAGRLDNSSGRIASNSLNLGLAARFLVNAGGRIEHANTGRLDLSAATLDGTSGDVGSLGTLTMAIGHATLDNATTVADRIAVDGTTLSHRQGRMTQTGAGPMSLTLTQGVDNSGGRIGSNGALRIDAANVANAGGSIQATGSSAMAIHSSGTMDNSAGGQLAAGGDLDVHAARLDNRNGQVVAGGSLGATVERTIDSQAGVLASNRDLVLKAIDLINDEGALQSKAGSIDIQLDGAMHNLQGQAAAAHDLHLQAIALDNSGSLYAAGRGDITTHGALTNSGVIAAQGDLTLHAQTLVSQALGTLAAGLRSDGTLGSTGELSLTAPEALVARGLNLAAGSLTARSGSIDLSGSRTSAQALIVDATVGDADIGKARLQAAQRATLSAAGLLRNDGGVVVATQLAVTAADLSNLGGQLLSSGTADSVIAVAQNLDNSAGTIAGNGNLNLAADRLVNRVGAIEAAGQGALTISTTGQLDNSAAGHLAAAGGATLDAGSVDNRHGTINAGAGLVARAARSIDNTAGTMAANQEVQVTAADLHNDHGQLQSQGAMALSLHEQFDNGQGQAFAGGPLDVRAAGLSNAGTLYTKGRGEVTIQGMLTNSGVIAAQGDLALQAQTVVSQAASTLAAGLRSDGTLGSAGDLGLTSRGALVARGLNLAAGGLTARGSSVDLAGSRGSAQTLVIDATAGDADLSKAGVDAAQHASLNAAGSLRTDGAAVGAAQLAVFAHDLSNIDGRLVQRGAADGVIAIARHIDNSHGVIASNGNLRVSADHIANRAGAIEGAGQAALTITVAGQLDNTAAGRIAAGGRATLDVDSLDNRRGTVSAGASLVARAARAIDNSAGTLATNQELQVTAVDLTNDQGQLQSQGAMSLTLEGRFDNGQGRAYAGGALRVQAAGLNTGGSFYADGRGDMTIHGVLTNSGVIAAHGDVALQANTLVSQVSGTLAAGLHADGTMGSAGDLSLSATDSLVARGLNLAAGQLTARGASVDLVGSRGSAQSVVIVASAGDADLSKARLEATGQATLNAAGFLRNDGAMVGAAQLAVTAHDLSNIGGQLIQSGTGESAIKVAQRLDNRGGTIGTNGALRIDAASVVNTGGKVQATGTSALTIDSAGALDNAAGGQLAAGGDLAVRVARIDNRGGQIVAGASLAATVEHTIDNSTGTFAAQRDLALMATDLVNDQGHLQSSAGGLDIQLRGAMRNLEGQASAARDLNLQAAELNNSGELYAEGRGEVAIRGALTNSGIIASHGNLALRARTLVSQAASTLAAGLHAEGTLGRSGDLSLSTAEALVAHGQNLAAGLLMARGASVDLAGSRSGAQTLVIDATTGDVNLSSAHVEATEGATFNVAGLLRNDGALVGAKRLAVAARDLSNTGGQLLQSGGADGVIAVAQKLDNSTGTIAGNGRLSLSADRIVNHAGAIEAAGQAVLTITTAGQLDNSDAGRIAAGGRATLDVGSLDNRRGTISAGDALVARSAGAIDNTAGLLATDQDLQLAAADLHNDQGQLESKAAMALKLDGRFDNGQGQAHAGGAMQVQAATLHNAGRVYAQGTATISIGGVLDNSGTIAAQGNTRLAAEQFDNAAGSLLAAGLDVTGHAAAASDLVLSAGQTVAAHGRVLATGELSVSGRMLDLSSSQASAVHIDLSSTAGDIDATGTTLVAIQALTANASQTLRTDGAQLSGARLLLSAHDLSNVAGSLVHTGNGPLSISLPGTLDNREGRIVGNGDVVLAAQQIDNRDGSLLAQQALTLGASSLDNSHGTLRTVQGDVDLLVSGRFANLVGQAIAANHLNLQAGELDNSGTLYAHGRAAIAVDGHLDNAGVIAAQGDATLRAGSLTSQSGSLLAAGQRSDGTFTTSGDLTLTAMQTLAAHGQNLAAGHLGATAARLDLSGSHGGANSVSLNATSGDAVLSLIELIASGKLEATAAGVLRTDGAKLSADKLALDAQSLSNVRGEILQSGSDALSVSLAGRFDNSGGVFASNGALMLGAQSVANQGGLIQSGGHGALILSAGGSVDNSASGRIVADGDATLVAETLINDRGRVEAGGALAVSTTRALMNSAGRLAANRDLTVKAASLDNTQGALLALQGTLDAKVAGRVDNLHGQAFAGGDLTLVAAELTNTGNLYAHGNSTIDVAGTLSNAGVIAAQGHGVVNTGRLSSQAGSVLAAGWNADGSAAAQGDLSLTAIETFAAQGQLLAAGSLGVQAAAIDLKGGSVGAQSIRLEALAGDIDASRATVAADRAFSADAAKTLRSDDANISAGRLSASAHDISNLHGSLLQTGGQDTLITATATLDNSTGRIASNGAALNLAAERLVNIDGRIEHAGSARLGIDATRFDDLRGAVASNGALVVQADLWLHDGAQTMAKQLTVSADSFSNHAGSLAQSGVGDTTITIAGALDNRGGAITSNGAVRLQADSLSNAGGRLVTSGSGALAITATTLDNSGQGQIAANGAGVLTAASLTNAGGTIEAGGPLTVSAQRAVDNSAGRLRAEQQLSVTSGAIDNDLGLLQSTQADVNLTLAGQLHNGHGQIDAGGNLLVQAGDIDNAGRLYAQGQAKLVASGRIDNTGLIAARDATTLTAQSLDNAADGTLAAGLLRDGHFGPNGDLTLSATQGLASQGHALAAGALKATAGGIDLSGSAGSAASIELTATTGDLDATRATLSADRGLVAKAAGTLRSDDANLTGAQLSLSVRDLSNRRGTLTQTGSGTTVLDVMASLDNSGGRIGTNGTDSSLGASTLINAGGSIAHAGSGALTITVDRLANSSGTIASNGNLLLALGALANQGGSVQSAGSLRLDASGTIDNSEKGRIAAAGALSVSGNSLANTRGQLSAGRTLTLDTVGSVANGQGLIAASGAVQVTGGAIDNSGGQIASVNGTLDLDTGGSLINDLGRIQAAGRTTLHSAGLTNHGGTIAGEDMQVDTRGRALVNTTGTIAARGTLDLQTGTLDNDAGTLSAAGTLTLDTHGLTLANTHSGGHAGILGRASVSVTTGDLDNTAGYIGAQGQLDVHGAAIGNSQGGILTSAGDLQLRATSLNNRGGQVQALADVTLQVGLGPVDNRGGLVRAGGTLDVEAARVVNRDTQGANQGLEGRDVRIAAAQIDNHLGAIRADNTLTVISGGHLDNTQGLLSAGKRLTILDPNAGVDGAQDHRTEALAIDNAGGRIVAGQSLVVDAASLAGNGAVQSAGDLGVKLVGDNTLAGLLQANGQAGVFTSGTLVNQASLQSGGSVTVSATNFENTAGAEISAMRSTVNVAGTLTNRGLIDGQETAINAGTLNNIGTGRIYGDHIGLQVAALNNLDENVNGATSSATVAARGRLDIGAQAVLNRNDALLFSVGDLAIGGALDANRHATGSATLLKNASATIEALGAMTLSSGNIANANEHFSYMLTPEVQGNGQATLEYAVPGQPRRYRADEVRLIEVAQAETNAGVSFVSYGHLHDAADVNWVGNSQYRQVLLPSSKYPWDKFAPYYAKRPDWSSDQPGCVGVNDGNGSHTVCGTVFDRGAHYASSNPIWRDFGVTPVTTPEPPEPGGCGMQDYPLPSGLGTGHRLICAPEAKGQHDAWVAAHAQWEADGVAADAALDAALATFGKDIFDHSVQNFDYWVYTTSKSQAQVLSSAPGKILSGGDMTLNGQSIVNDKSQIIAGGVLTYTGAMLQNLGATVQATETRTGTAIHSWFNGVCDSCGDDREYAASSFSDSVPYTLTLGVIAPRSHTTPGGLASGEQMAAFSAAGVGGAVSAAGPANAALHAGATTGAAIDLIAPGATPAGAASSVPRSAVERNAAAMNHAGGYLASTQVAGRSVTAPELRGFSPKALAINDTHEAVDAPASSAAADVSTAAAQRMMRDAGLSIPVRSSAGAGTVSMPGGLVEERKGVKLPGAVAAGGAVSTQGGAVHERVGVKLPGALAANGAVHAPGDIIEDRASVKTPDALTSGSMAPAANGIIEARPNGSLPGALVHGNAPSSTGAVAAAGGIVPAPVALSAKTGFVIRTTSPNTTLPNASLFRRNPDPRAHALIETDPRFTDAKTWLSSNYLLDQLTYDPATSQKRLGDGYYEQLLVRQQVAELSGHRFLDGYASDEAEYRALLTAGAAYAKSANLIPGVALSEAQMAQLTSDIVWLVARDVTLADGSVQSVLVPQVYARLRPGDLDGTGTLMSGASVVAHMTGALVNSGIIAGRDVVSLSAENVRNLNGRITGATVGLDTRTDLDNIGGVIDGSKLLSISAGRDLNVVSTTASGATATNTRTAIDRVAGLYVSDADGVLLASAGRDVNFIAGGIANAGSVTQITAGRDLNLGTVTAASSSHTVWSDNNVRADATSTDIGTTIRAQGNVLLKAEQDLTARAANVTSAAGRVAVFAGRDVNLLAGRSSAHVNEAHEYEGSDGFTTMTTVTRDSVEQTRALASTLSGDTTVVQAGRDIGVQGSNVVSGAATILTAQRNINIEVAIDRSRESHYKNVQLSGMLDGGGLSFGHSEQADDLQNARTSALASTVGATQGHVGVRAGERYRQIGSDVVALSGDITIAAPQVEIADAQVSEHNRKETRFEQSSVSIGVNSSVQSAAQSVVHMADAADKTQDSRVQALAFADAAMSMLDTVSAMQAVSSGSSGVGISVAFGQSQSRSTTESTSRGTVGSRVQAGGNVTLSATGAGHDSTLTVRGSDVTASGNVKLSSDGAINLLAARNDSEQHSTSSSSSSSVGVTAGVGGGGMSFSITAAANSARGNADGTDTSWTNSHVNAGKAVTIESGGDTTLKGAVVKGQRVGGGVGGTLSIQSLQDTLHYDARQEHAGASATVGYGTSSSVNASYGSGEVNGDFSSVHEQSGIQAGDQGFQLQVLGKTDLQGAVIESTQAAVDKKLNTLQTAALVTSDMQNRDSYAANGFGVSGSYGNSQGQGGAPGQKTSAGLTGSSAGVGRVTGGQSSMTRAGVSGAQIAITDEVLQKSLTSKDVATTVAGLNREVVTGNDTSGALKPGWDGQKLMGDVQAQVEVTAAFGSQAAKAVGDYAGSKIYPYQQAQIAAAAARQVLADPSATTEQKTSAQTQLSAAQRLMSQQQATYDHWKEGGDYRVATHSAAGALGGGFAGVLGAGSSAALMPQIGKDIDQLALPEQVKQAIGLLVAGVFGAITGGSAGTASSLNIEANNRQLTHTELDRIKLLAHGDSLQQSRLTAAACAMVHCADGIPRSDAGYDFLNSLQDAGASMSSEQSLLGRQSGWEGRAVQGLFQSSWVDQYLVDPAKRNQLGTRSGGAVQAVSGGVLAEAGVGACLTGIGCAFGAAGVVIGADMLKAGAATALTGASTSTLGEQALRAMGVSSTAAATLYEMAGSAPMMLESAIAKGATRLANNSVAAADKVATEKFLNETRISNNFYQDGAMLPPALSTSSGITIRAVPGKTTTVVGSHQMDIRDILNNQLDYPVNSNFGTPKPGGFNLLNVPSDINLTPDEFFNQINRPFLDAAIRRGDEIALATRPEARFINQRSADGSVGRTMFGREYDYLTSLGFKYDPATLKMVRLGG